MSRARNYFTAEKKARIVRRHLADNVPVSDLADEFGVQPSQIHMWVKQAGRKGVRAIRSRCEARALARARRLKHCGWNGAGASGVTVARWLFSSVHRLQRQAARALRSNHGAAIGHRMAPGGLPGPALGKSSARWLGLAAEKCISAIKRGL